MEYYLHEIITYILSFIIPSVNKDLKIQKNILSQMNLDENSLDNNDLYNNDLYNNDLYNNDLDDKNYIFYKKTNNYFRNEYYYLDNY